VDYNSPVYQMGQWAGLVNPCRKLFNGAMSDAKDAASLILYQQDAGSLRVLMGLRHAGHKFLPNRMVFPGGRVDAEDFGAETASALPDHALAHLEPHLALALGHAAARELAEETGLSLGTPPALAGLHYLCRAITPSGYPIRFDARFFVGHAALASGTLAGSGELEALDWYEVEAILQLQINEATRAVLEKLRVWLALDPAGRLAWRPPVFREARWDDD
jgi:8-oxo-dGTP pyrophosphatase MutT (NUDIX family)